MARHLALKAYGKINLGLDVLKRREDGYHEVRMIMQTVGIFDRLDLEPKPEPGISVECNLYYLPIWFTGLPSSSWMNSTSKKDSPSV